MMRPVLTEAEYRKIRNTEFQQSAVKAVRGGDEALKHKLVQMNYSCLPNDDGSLKGSTRVSNTVGMDVDHIEEEKLQEVKEHILAKREQLGLLMLETSARGKGFHLVFKRRAGLSQEENLRWASALLGVEYDKGAKDITRVFFTTSEEDLIFLDNQIFDETPQGYETETEFPTKRDEVATKTEGETKFPTEFKGIPYKEIVAEYWRRKGGEPVEGERNEKLYQLATALRAICDNQEEWLLGIMPRYGLSEQEMQSIVHSACKETPKGVSKMMRAIILENERMRNGENENDLNESGSGKLSVSWRKLPIGLRESLVGVPKEMHLPVLAGIMPIAGAYADGVEVEYCDGNIHRLGLMSIIRGEQASNKSVVKTAIDVWKRQFDEEDRVARKREDEWKERRKGRKANEKAPEDPKVLIRMVPVTVSCSTLLKRFKNANGHTIYSFGEELDTLRKTNGAGSWSSKYDIYRLSFDNGEWGQDYNSDQAESGVVNVAYNWTMLGTDGALRKCFRQDNIENGLSSRVFVAEMPDSSFQKMPKFGRRSAEDEARIQEAVTRLRSATGLVEVPRLRKAIEKWVEEKRIEAAKNIDHVMDVYRKRAAVIGFRCGVIHHLLQTHPQPLSVSEGSGQETSVENQITNQEESVSTPLPKRATGVFREATQCGFGPTKGSESPLATEGRKGESPSTIKFALLMAEYCLEQQMKVFGEALRNEYMEARDECQRYGANHSVFDQLPPVFTINDLRALKQGFCGEPALRKITSRWCGDQWIKKIDRNHWKKE